MFGPFMKKGLTEWGLRPCRPRQQNVAASLRTSAAFSYLRHLKDRHLFFWRIRTGWMCIWRAVEPGHLCVRTWRCFEIHFHRKAASRGEGLRCRRAASAVAPLGAGPSPDNRCLSRERRPLERGGGQGSNICSSACMQAEGHEGCT